MSSGSLQAVNILLDAGAEVSHSLKFMENADIPIEIKQRLNQYAQQNNMKPASTADGEKYGRLVETDDVLYFTYGSLKNGFPNFDDHADILNNFSETLKPGSLFLLSYLLSQAARIHIVPIFTGWPHC